MSLLKKKTTEQPDQPVPAPIERDAMTTKAKVLEEQAAERRAYQKENRKRHLNQWNADKKTLDGLTEEQQFIDFMEQLQDERRDRDPRVGLHSMKVNSYELAMIKLAMKKTESRSSRELLTRLCEQINDGAIKLS